MFPVELHTNLKQNEAFALPLTGQCPKHIKIFNIKKCQKFAILGEFLEFRGQNGVTLHLGILRFSVKVSNYVLALSMISNKLRQLSVKFLSRIQLLTSPTVFTKRFPKQKTMDCAFMHPCDSNRLWFLMFDLVRIWKSIRNNCLNLKHFNKNFRYPQFDNMDMINIATFEEIRQLYRSEQNKIIKLAPRLTSKSNCAQL